MEKYEKLFKGLEMCAGPECSEECPYHGETRGGKTCRAWLLMDASTAIINEQGHADAAMQDRDAVEAENDSLRERCKEKDKLLAELHTRCQIQQDELNALVRKMGGKHDGKTDRPSACFDDVPLTGRPADVVNALEKRIKELLAEGAYWNGKAHAYFDILSEYGLNGPRAAAKIAERYSSGGGGRHD